MRRMVIALSLVMLAAPLSAQRIKIDFPALSDRADEVVDVTLNATMLRIASKFLSTTSKDELAVRSMVQKLEGIYVRSYSFKGDNQYDPALVDRVRSQLGSSWQRIVTVKSKSRENVEVYTDMRGEEVRGLVVISAEPRQLTIVNIVGPIDLDRISELTGLGVPDIRIDREKKQP